MKKIKDLLVAVATAIVIGCNKLFRAPALPRAGFANTYDEAVETIDGDVPYKTDDTVSTRHLLFKQGSDANHIAICGASDEPLGTVDNKSLVAEDRCTLLALGLKATRKMVASEAISAGEDVYTAASGKVQDEPASAGTYYLIGQARTAAGADGDVIDVYTCRPVRVIVLALPGNANSEISGVTLAAETSTNGTAAAASADLAALAAEAEKIGDDVRDVRAKFATLVTKLEELGDDFRALSAGAAQPSLLKWLAS